MKIENTVTQMRKGLLEYCILTVVSKYDKIYTSDLLNELKEAEVVVVEGTIYPLLTRLKNAGLLNYQWIESRQGPPRKYYTITEAGLNFLAQLNKEWNSLVSSVQKIEHKK